MVSTGVSSFEEQYRSLTQKDFFPRVTPQYHLAWSYTMVQCFSFNLQWTFTNAWSFCGGSSPWNICFTGAEVLSNGDTNPKLPSRLLILHLPTLTARV